MTAKLSPAEKRAQGIPSRSLPLRGDRFGLLTVVAVGAKDKNQNTRWICLCDCGQVTLVRASSLVHGNTKSCGCLRSTIQAHLRASGQPDNNNNNNNNTESKSSCKPNQTSPRR